MFMNKKSVLINTNGKNKTEFHCHTSNSFDCDISIGERLESLIKRKFTHVVITDHDRNLSRKQVSYCKFKFPEINVINGIEVSSSYGHIILIDCSYRPIINSLWFIVLWANIFSCQILIPHPARELTGLLDVFMRNGLSIKYVNWFIDKCTYFEVFNLRDSRKDKVDVNKVIFSRIMKLKPVIGSDSHFLDDIYEDGNTMNEVESDPQLIENFINYFNLKHIELKFSYSELWRTIKSTIKYLLRYT